MRSPERPVTLSEDVIALLDQGKMTEAIAQLLETHPWMKKTDAMRMVMNYRIHHPQSGPVTGEPGDIQESGPKVTWTIPYTVINLGGFLAFMWLFVNLFVLASSLIILTNLDGYHETEFRVIRHYYVTDTDGGESWGLRGIVEGRELRYSDPSLVTGPSGEIARELADSYPPDTVVTVLYNPALTDELFQDRTVNVIPYSNDPAAIELQRIGHWATICLLPLAGFLFTGWLMRKSGTATVTKMSP